MRRFGEERYKPAGFALPMTEEPDLKIESLIAELDDAFGSAEAPVRVGDVVEMVGHRSFPALLLLPALVVTTPLSSVPGVSMVGGVAIFLIAAQHVFGRKHTWLPGFIAKRDIEPKTMDRFLKAARVISRFADKVLRPRLQIFVRPPFSSALIAAAMVMGLVMPVLEFIPTTSSIVAGAVSLFSLALVSGDGLLALIGLMVLLLVPAAAYWLLT